MDEAVVDAVRSDVNLYLGTRGRGQWFTASQLYEALGIARRTPPVPPEEFAALLHELARRKVVQRWRSEGGSSSEMFGLA
jgi:hypothetical protein